MMHSSLNRMSSMVRLPVIRQKISRMFSASSSASDVLPSAELSSSASDVLPSADLMISILKRSLGASKVEVTDVSGGCGAFFKILVVAPVFNGIPMVKAHRLVLEALEKDVGKMHGLTIETRKEERT